MHVVLVGLGVLALLLLALFVLRRSILIRRLGAIEMSVRLTQRWWFGGWSLGVASYSGDELRWYRVFSLLPAPSRRLNRRTVIIDRQRAPSDGEVIWVPPDAVILECVATATSRATPQDIAISRRALTGILSWWEAAAPGPQHPRIY